MRRDIHKMKRADLIIEIQSLKFYIEYLNTLIDYFKYMCLRYRKTERDAWDIRNMIPLVEYGEKYLKGCKVSTVYNLVNKGKLDAYVIKYKYRSVKPNSESADRKFTMIPLTRKNLAFNSKYTPQTPLQVKSKLRISKLVNDFKLEVNNEKPASNA